MVWFSTTKAKIKLLFYVFTTRDICVAPHKLLNTTFSTIVYFSQQPLPMRLLYKVIS